jgi:hypothetical protein
MERRSTPVPGQGGPHPPDRFFYRPKVETQASKGVDDVQRLYMILSPTGRRRAASAASPPPGLGLDEARRANFPNELRERFRGGRFINVDPPDFLDYEGAEILLFGASQEVSGDLAIQLQPTRETEATAEIFNDLRMEKSLHPIMPLLKGKWE